MYKKSLFDELKKKKEMVEYYYSEINKLKGKTNPLSVLKFHDSYLNTLTVRVDFTQDKPNGYFQKEFDYYYLYLIRFYLNNELFTAYTVQFLEEIPNELEGITEATKMYKALYDEFIPEDYISELEYCMCMD